jgi:thioredoxin-like negative regulator of GroEL
MVGCLRITLALCVLASAALPGCAAPHALRASAARQEEHAAWRELLEIAQLLALNGQGMRAQQYLREALRQGAPAERVVPRLLQLYVADAQYRLAADLAEHYLRAHPRDRGVRLFLGAVYAALAQDVPAVEQYARVVAQAPDDAQAHFALASTLHDAGREPLRADKHYRAYLALEPQGDHAEEVRALLLTELP